MSTEIKAEFAVVDPNLTIEFEEIELPKKVMTTISQETLLHVIYATFNGVYKMSHSMKDLVETSNNLARVLVKDESIEILCLTRSSSESSKMDLVNLITSNFKLAGYHVETSGSYPGWQPNVNSPILNVLQAKYEELFNEKPNVVACHAGLECGILGTNYPDMDMISFGPTIKGAHSPDERAHIGSSQKFWKFLTEILKNIPEKR